MNNRGFGIIEYILLLLLLLLLVVVFKDAVVNLIVDLIRIFVDRLEGI